MQRTTVVTTDYDATTFIVIFFDNYRWLSYTQIMQQINEKLPDNRAIRVVIYIYNGALLKQVRMTSDNYRDAILFKGIVIKELPYTPVALANFYCKICNTNTDLFDRRLYEQESKVVPLCNLVCRSRYFIST